MLTIISTTIQFSSFSIMTWHIPHSLLLQIKWIYLISHYYDCINYIKCHRIWNELEAVMKCQGVWCLQAHTCAYAIFLRTHTHTHTAKYPQLECSPIHMAPQAVSEHEEIGHFENCSWAWKFKGNEFSNILCYTSVAVTANSSTTRFWIHYVFK